MYNYRLSIIIPAYNMDSCIKSCLNSLLKKPTMDAQIIVINDGSTDSTEEVLSSFKGYENYSYVTTENHGVSAARNLGITMAQGEYVWFVDADDQIDSTFIERAISLLKKGTSHGNQWDWLVFGSLNIFASGNTTSHALQNDLRLETRKQFHNHFDDIFSQLPYNVPWNKFFKRTIIMEHRLSFPPMTTGEDAAFITSYLPYVNTCCVLAETPYYYQLESSSSMRSTHRALKEYQDNRNRIFSQTKTFQRLGLKSDKVTSESVYRLIYGTYILLYQSVHNKQNSLKVFLRSTHALPGLTEFLALAENLPMTPRIRILRFFVQHPFAFYLYYQIRSAR